MKRHPFLFVFTLSLLLLVTVACGGGNGGDEASTDADTADVAAGDPAAGEERYNSVCISCHGEEGVGVEGLGKPLNTSEFVSQQSNQELLEFIKQGRPASDPANTTGVDMPPKGGNPALSDQEILDIIAYIRQLQEEQG